LRLRKETLIGPGDDARIEHRRFNIIISRWPALAVFTLCSFVLNP
jgi:hypothetical protein